MSLLASRPPISIACLAAALVTTGAPRVYALSCAVPEVVVPFPDSVEVPTNTLVWCSKPAESSPSPIRLRDAEGADVGGTQTYLAMPWSEVLVFRPAAELAPNSEYTVDCPIRYDTQPSFVFTTGSGASTTPPAVPSVSNMDFVVASDTGWGPSHFARFLQASAAQTILVVDLTGSRATLNPNGPSGSVSDARYVFQDDDVWVGNGPCGGNWPDAALGASTRVALGAFDPTGAFSGWSDTVSLTMPSVYPSTDDGEDDANTEESSDPPDVSERDPVEPGDEDATDVAEDLEDNIAATNATDDIPASRPSPLGRSGCALGMPGASAGASAGVSAGLLLVLGGLAARRRRSRSNE